MTRSPDTHERDLPNRPEEEPTNARAEESDIDRILADSFPASDAPPWTLGVAQRPANSSEARGSTVRRRRDND